MSGESVATSVEDDAQQQSRQEQRVATRKDFEVLIHKQLTSQAQQIRDAFKEMVSLIIDARSSREALSALKEPIKRDNALIQLKGLSILGALVKNCGHDFHVELATKKWMDRLVKLARTTQDERVRDKILQLLVDWAEQFQLQMQLDEFSIALHRLKARGVELPPPSEGRKEKRTARRTRSTDMSSSRSKKEEKSAQLTAIEILATNIQADIANLELGLQRPEILQEGIADECRKHLQKIQVILSTDLPDQAIYEFFNMSDQLHELLGLYDALYTDSTPEELQRDRDLSEMRALDQQIKEEERLCQRRQQELEDLNKQVSAAKEELKAAMEEARLRAQMAPKSEKEKAIHAKLMQVMSNCAHVRQSANELMCTMEEGRANALEYNQKFLKELDTTLMQFPMLVEKARLGESQAFLHLKRLYTIEVNTRKQLYNKLQELRGNIRVYARVRPLSAKEAKEESAMSYPAEGEIVVRENPNKQRAFEFDIVYSEKTKQEEVFEDTKPLINCVVDGYKVCIFAYGQTGSGKTFTMQGPPDNPGINRRALCRLFEIIEERADVEKIAVTISVLEIYNETIRDLLNDRADTRDKVKYDIKTHPVDGQYIENLTSIPVKAARDIDIYMAKAEKNRSCGRTNMNEHSSRSHMVLYVVVRSTNLQSGVTTVGKVSLVDLAGSERVGKSGATGERMKEAQAINKSLSALGDVISALSRNESHIPYRNSKLTHLLQDSLGGNSKCLMFVNVSPAASNVAESINSLQFAFRARGVALGTAKKNIVASTADDTS